MTTPVKLLKSFDMFSSPLPAFNINGKDSVKTSIGGFMSLIFGYITLIFAINKFQDMAERKNPNINTFVDKDALGTNDRYELTSANDFIMAFALEDMLTYKPQFVKWTAEYWLATDSNIIKRAVNMYKCTEKDLDKFFPLE